MRRNPDFQLRIPKTNHYASHQITKSPNCTSDLNLQLWIPRPGLVGNLPLAAIGVLHHNRLNSNSIMAFADIFDPQFPLAFLTVNYLVSTQYQFRFYLPARN